MLPAIRPCLCPAGDIFLSSPLTSSYRKPSSGIRSKSSAVVVWIVVLMEIPSFPMLPWIRRFPHHAIRVSPLCLRDPCEQRFQSHPPPLLQTAALLSRPSLFESDRKSVV